MMDPVSQILDLRTARALLQRLRDANTRVSLFPGGNARLMGCQSLDEPVEGGVHYKLCIQEGESLELRLDLRESQLFVDCRRAAQATTLRLRFLSAGAGAIYIEELDVRIQPDANDEEVIELLMRRLGAYALDRITRDERASA